MSLNVDELRGLVQVSLRGRKRVVPLLSHFDVPADPDAAVIAVIARKNARAHTNLQRDPKRLEARRKYMREWRANNSASVRSYRAAWVMRNEEAVREYNRDYKRGRYQRVGLRTTLTEEIVLAMRSERASGRVTIKSLAAKYGVSRSGASRALSGKRWAHV